MPDFKVMRPYDYESRKLRFPCLVQPKYDGVRVFYHNGSFWTKTGKPIVGMELYERWMAGVNHDVDFEATITGQDFDTVSGTIRSHDIKENVVLNVIDVATLGTMKLVDRYTWINMRFGGFQFIRPIPHVRIFQDAEVLMWYKIYLKEGFEGVMIKSLESIYEDRRSWDWMRIKPTLAFNATILNKVEGKGKYKGTLGTLIVKRIRTGEHITIGRGKLKDQQANCIWHNFRKYSGRVCEVTYERRTPRGGYRHPRFNRMRYDL